MTFPPDQPISRRALREARGHGDGQGPVTAAEGVVEASVEAGSAVPAFPPAEPVQTGFIDLDGTVLSRRRLREIRETQAQPIIPPASDVAAPTPSASGATVPLRPILVPVETAVSPPAPDAAAPEAAVTGPAPITVPTPTITPLPEFPRPTTFPPPAASEPPAAPVVPIAAETPAGHWTRQLAETDEQSEVTPAREVGGAPQTATLVVVDHPTGVVDLGGPLNATGEVLYTGTINLSPDFAQTGAVGPVSGAELDDHFDRPAESPDSPPVKATAVASQHALGSPIVANSGRRNGRGMTALLIIASVLAVAVTGLVVAAILLHWFE
ncbi:MAG: hypothetical protein QM662_18520 [Gordonia sp. (in: high G+C Gram-positive bacteria)]